MIRVAVLSFWHVHAKDYTQQALEHPDVELAAIWDENAERGRVEASRRGVPFVEDIQEIFQNGAIDGVIVTSPTSQHRDLIGRAAQAGKHVFTEKVLASTLKEAHEIVSVVEQSGVVLTVSLPRLNAGYTQAIQEILAQGKLGKLTLIRSRLSHNGAIPSHRGPQGWLPSRFYDLENCGGGAMIDLGCHPMYLTRLFGGLPDSISATYGYITNREVEDNAIAILHYQDGQIGVVEAGFVNSDSPFTIEIHGTEGSLIYGMPDNTLTLKTSRSASDGTGQWVLQDSLPPDKPSSFDQWVEHIQTGTSPADNIQMALDLTRLMEASNLSAKGNRRVSLADLADLAGEN